MLFITEQQMWSRKLQFRYYGVEKKHKNTTYNAQNAGGDFSADE